MANVGLRQITNSGFPNPNISLKMCRISNLQKIVGIRTTFGFGFKLRHIPSLRCGESYNYDFVIKLLLSLSKVRQF